MSRDHTEVLYGGPIVADLMIRRSLADARVPVHERLVEKFFGKPRPTNVPAFDDIAWGWTWTNDSAGCRIRFRQAQRELAAHVGEFATQPPTVDYWRKLNAYELAEQELIGATSKPSDWAPWRVTESYYLPAYLIRWAELGCAVDVKTMPGRIVDWDRPIDQHLYVLHPASGWTWNGFESRAKLMDQMVEACEKWIARVGE